MLITYYRMYQFMSYFRQIIITTTVCTCTCSNCTELRWIQQQQWQLCSSTGHHLQSTHRNHVSGDGFRPVRPLSGPHSTSLISQQTETRPVLLFRAGGVRHPLHPPACLVFGLQRQRLDSDRPPVRHLGQQNIPACNRQCTSLSVTL